MAQALKNLRKSTTNKLATYRQAFGLLVYEPALFAWLALVSLLTPFTETFGIGLILPLLQGAQPDAGVLGDLPFFGQFIQQIGNMSAIDRVRFVAVALVVVILFRSVFSYTSQILAFLLKIKVDRQLRERVFRQLLGVEIRYIYRQRLGNLFTLLNDYTRQSGALAFTLAQGIINLCFVAIYVTLMFLLSWQMTLVTLFLLIAVFLLVRKRLTAKLYEAGQGVKRAMADLNTVGFESLSALKLIHLFSRHSRAFEKFKHTLNDYQTRLYQQGKLNSLMSPLFSMLNVVVLSLLLLFSSLVLPSQTEGWMGLLFLFLIIMFRLMEPVSMLNSLRGKAIGMFPMFQSVHDFLNREDKLYLENGRKQLRRFHRGITLNNVSFRYNESEDWVLQEITFEIPKDQMTAIVGPSGAGKSTLVDLVARLYDPQQGSIRVDGIGLREIDLNSWRGQLAMVSQDTFIFNDTVMENLRFSKEDATNEEIYRAARLANAHDFIVDLPEGYHTLLGDRGVRLSGGQRQRIAIARALLANPALLILDEATSSLDSETERKIQSAIDQVSRGRTVLSIAHRLSTIQRADNIVFLDGGQLVEQGTHEQLMKRKGHYAHLVQMQSLERVDSPIY